MLIPTELCENAILTRVRRTALGAHAGTAS
eukprot:COSAG06_NODE_54481_length_294_cov_0.871795_1_plen_29_part_10